MARATRSAGPASENGSSLQRMLAVLDLFTAERPQWTVEEIAEAHNLTQSTAYRYVGALCSSGLLASFGAAQYSLGSRIIALDLTMRQTDPLIGLAEQTAPQLLNTVPEGVVSLISLRGDTAISIFQDKKPDDLQISFERGRSMGIFSGAASKVILAHLPRAKQMKLFADFPELAAQSGLGQTWKTFSKSLLAIRREKAIYTRGEVEPRSWGIAAPIFDALGEVTSSLALIMPRESFSAEAAVKLIDEVAGAASRITEKLKQEDTRSRDALIGRQEGANAQ